MVFYNTGAIFFSQLEVKQKPFMTHSKTCIFSCTLSVDWIGQSDYFGFGFIMSTQLKTAISKIFLEAFCIYKFLQIIFKSLNCI